VIELEGLAAAFVYALLKHGHKDEAREFYSWWLETREELAELEEEEAPCPTF
jgi:hypothetical protein